MERIYEKIEGIPRDLYAAIKETHYALPGVRVIKIIRVIEDTYQELEKL